MPRIREAIRSGWKYSSWSSFSPTEIELDRPAGDGLHRERRAAARVAVELRHHDAVERDPLLERQRDVDGLLARHRVEHEQHVRRLRLVADSLELLHQLLVDVQAARRVEDDRVDAVLGAAAGRRRARPRPDRCPRRGRREPGSACRAARAGRSRPGAAGRRRRAPGCGLPFAAAARASPRPSSCPSPGGRRAGSPSAAGP